jgi:hypothetical protein
MQITFPARIFVDKYTICLLYLKLNQTITYPILFTTLQGITLGDYKVKEIESHNKNCR